MGAKRGTNRNQAFGTGIGALLGVGVLSVGPLAVGIGMLAVRHVSLRDMEAAKSWVETPCVMEKCEFVSGGDEGRALDIVYRYEIDGKTYRGDRLDSIVGRMGDDDEFEDFVFESFPPGAHATCYVDPANPSNSMFDREHGSDAPRRMWLLAFPFLCAGVGFGLVVIGTVFGSHSGDDDKQDDRANKPLSAPAPPPRRIPFTSQFAILAGPASSQLAWLFVVGFTYVFIIMDGPASYARLLNITAERETVIGRVTDVRGLDAHELHRRVYQFSVEYDVDGRNYASKSYMRGERYDEGEEVELTYVSDAPDQATIAGARASELTWWHSLIPLIVLVLLAMGLTGMYVHSRRAFWLLKRGVLATARWQTPSPQDAELQARYATALSNYHFDVGGRSYAAKRYSPAAKGGRRKRGDADSDSPEEVLVLYRPSRPGINIILDQGLADLIDDRYRWRELIVQVAPAVLAVAALITLFQFA